MSKETVKLRECRYCLGYTAHIGNILLRFSFNVFEIKHYLNRLNVTQLGKADQNQISVF